MQIKFHAKAIPLRRTVSRKGAKERQVFVGTCPWHVPIAAEDNSSGRKKSSATLLYVVVHNNDKNLEECDAYEA